jgi:hypothetical protein
MARVCRSSQRRLLWPVSGWRSRTRRDSRVRSSSVHRATRIVCCAWEPWRNGQRARLSRGRLRDHTPSAPLPVVCLSSLRGRNAGPKSPMVPFDSGGRHSELDDAAHAGVVEWQTRDAQNVVGTARGGSSPSAGITRVADAQLPLPGSANGKPRDSGSRYGGSSPSPGTPRPHVQVDLRSPAARVPSEAPSRSSVDTDVGASRA